MLVEQRTANSYYRRSMAEEMSEAGIEWAVAMLNSTAIDENCKPVSTGGKRFVDRYLTFLPEDRGLRQNMPFQTPGVFAADCVRKADGWSCRCLDYDKRTELKAVASTDLVPSFAVSLEPRTKGGLLGVVSHGCSSSNIDPCWLPEYSVTLYQASSMQEGLLALVSAVRSPPAAPLVAKGSITASGGGLGLHNTDPGSAGLLVLAGGKLSGLVDERLQSVPGTPPSQAKVQDDPQLSKTDADAFRMFMGAKASRYVLHPSLRKVTCAGDCAEALQAAYQAGMRIIWVDGPLTISSNRVIGAVTDPVVIIADGDLTLSGPFQVSGMLVSRGNVSWSNSSGMTSLVNGIVLAEGNVQTDGTMDIVYDTKVVNQLRNRIGSFVRVPGGWREVGSMD
ncbi:MAG: hypothetical protein ACK4R2_01460 [Roseateles sp.]